MQTKLILLVGSNNETKELEIDKLCEIASTYVEDFTVSRTLGYWQGEPEQSVKLEIITNEVYYLDLGKNLARSICKHLRQDAVMLEIERGNYELITN